MKKAYNLKGWFLVVFTVTLAYIWSPGLVRADSNRITPSEIKYSEPFELTASIMEIDHGKNMLIVAENRIYVIDLMIHGENIKTVLSDADGENIFFDSFERGQTVRVSGMRLSDGRVIAEEVVLQSSQP
jgi:hypothetical protein